MDLKIVPGVKSMNRQQTERYSRQLLIPGFGVKGQKDLINGSVLIVGCGGLGSPCALYLASSGVGTIGLVDFDKVEVSNLHRQIIHRASSCGTPKTESAAATIADMNPLVKVIQHQTIIDAKNAIEIISVYDVVVDASDNVITRYIVNDVCSVLKKPLVSGSALRWEGHITTFIPGGACYRCLYPTPTPPSAVTNCESGGILPPVVGVIGSMQAMEVIKLLIGKPPSYSGKMALYNAETGLFKTLALRSKNFECICSTNTFDPIEFEYDKFCKGSSVCDKSTSLKLLDSASRMTPQQFSLLDSTSYLLIDVRPRDQFEICSLPGSRNLQLNELVDLSAPKDTQIITVCRRGNQSQRAVFKLRELGYTNVKDIIGGVTAYGLEVDLDFPIY
jgi:adenylyltransferase and sulfurtransferase